MTSSVNTSADLAQHLRYLEAEYAAALAAPLSRKRAMLVALLVDAFADRLFAADPGAEDVLVFRASLAADSSALGLVFALAAQSSDGPRLVLEPMPVPLAKYEQLSVEDFMVSLYNHHTVQRVHIALPDGTRLQAHDVLGEAIAALHSLVGVRGHPPPRGGSSAC